MRRHPFCLVWLILVCCILSLGTCIHAQFRYNSWAKAEAVVMAVEDLGRARGYSYAPLLRFETRKGEVACVRSRQRCGSDDYRVGTRVPVLYPIESPEEAIIPTWWRLYGLSALFLFVALLMSFATFLAWFSARRGRVMRDEGC